MWELLNVILPADAGCNLKCSFCLISQREEITMRQLEPSGFVHFIREIALIEPVMGIALQGYEPLLPGTLANTTAILAAGKELGIPVSLVTNGTHLGSAMPELWMLPTDEIGVSLDATAPERHDRLRGVSSAWRQTVDGVATTSGCGEALCRDFNANAEEKILPRRYVGFAFASRHSRMDCKPATNTQEEPVAGCAEAGASGRLREKGYEVGASVNKTLMRTHYSSTLN